MSTRNRILVGLLLVQTLVLLAAQMMPEGTKQGSQTLTLLPELQSAQITRLAIDGALKEGADGAPDRIELKSKGDKWVLSSADDYPVKMSEVNKALSLLKGLKSRTRVLEQSTYHQKLEVAPSRYQRKVEVDYDGGTVVFFIGTSPAFKTAHLRLGSQDDVFQVGDLSTYDFDPRATKWVEQPYVDVEQSHVISLNLENQYGALRLERALNTGEWVLLGSSDAPKAESLKGLLDKAAKVNLESPVGRNVKPEYGLEQPRATLRITHAQPGADPETVRSVTLRIGAKLDGADRYYAKASTSDYVVEVAGWAVKPLLEKKQADLLDQGSSESTP